MYVCMCKNTFSEPAKQKQREIVFCTSLFKAYLFAQCASTCFALKKIFDIRVYSFAKIKCCTYVHMYVHFS